MNERIKELRLYLHLTQKEFGLSIGLNSSISDIEQGKAPITERTIIAICYKYDINEDWLRFGKGSMFNNKKENDSFFYDLFSKLNDSLKSYILNTAKNLLENQ